MSADDRKFRVLEAVMRRPASQELASVLMEAAAAGNSWRSKLPGPTVTAAHGSSVLNYLQR